MGAVHHDLAGEPTFEPMIQIDMEMNAFVSTWRHCDYVSTYMARMIGQNRPDSVRHSNLFSSAFNELLEDRFLLGSPAEVAEQMVRLNRRLGVNHIVASVHWPGMPNNLALDQLQILAEEVMPLVRRGT